MSIGTEILMRDIVDTLNGAVLLSEFGDGCALLDEATAPPVRIARRPVGGVVCRGDLTTFAPPLDLNRMADDCRRIAQHAPVVVDAVTSEAADLIARAEDLAPDQMAVLRVRGDEYPAHTLKLIYQDPIGLDHLYLRRDLISDEITGRSNALMSATVDEFDTLAKAIGRGSVLKELRHGAGLSEAILNPAPTLDQPDSRQVAAALGERRAIMAANGGCALIIAQLSGAPQPVSVTISGLDAGAPDPVISLPNAPDWTIRATRDGVRWRADAIPEPGAASLVSVFAEIEAPESPEAEVTEITTAIIRKRGAWEIWDEAQKQLELEESW